MVIVWSLCNLKMINLLIWQLLTLHTVLMRVVIKEQEPKRVKVWLKKNIYHSGDWDKDIPPKEYFDELKRVSENQIIWGGNYFLDHLSNTPCMIIWDKDNGTNYYADCEIAWTSFDSAVRKFRWRWHGFLQENNKNKQIRIHPTEKPIALYSWLLQNYAQKGQKILDTHGGSMSHAIAAHDMGFDLTIIEKDPIYYEQAKKKTY